MMSGKGTYLHQWQRTMPPGTAGLCLSELHRQPWTVSACAGARVSCPQEDRDRIIDAVRDFGGLVSMRALPDGGEAPYELNITFYDAMKGTFDGEDGNQFNRFVCSQTIPMAMEGIPAFYVHSLLGQL